MRMVWCILMGLALSGCTGVASLTAALNDRQVTSCLWFQGAAGPYATVLGVTATGGTPLQHCLDARRP